MFALIALVTQTTLGNYPTEASCMNAIKQIYRQTADPQNRMPKDVLQLIVDRKMQIYAPREYLCQKQ